MLKQKAVRTVSLLWLSSLAGAGLAFLTQATIARGLGKEAFGAFSSSLAFVTLLIPLAGFGLPQFWLKAFGEEGWGAVRWLKDSLSFAFYSCMFVILIIIGWSLIGNHDPTTKTIFLLFILFLIGQLTVELVSSKLQLEEDYINLAAWHLFPHALRFLAALGCLVAINDDSKIYGFGAAYAITGIALVIVSIPHLCNLYKNNLALVGHGLKKTNVGTTSPGIRHVILQSAPFGMAGSFHLIYFQSAVFLLAYLSGNSEAGIYSVAFLMMNAVYILPNIIYQKFLLPKIHRWAHQDSDLFYRSYRFGSIAMLGIGTLASLLIWALSPYLLPLLFGMEYANSIDVLRWLSLCAPLRFMATSIGSVLVTQSTIIMKVRCMGLVAAVSLALSFLLIPKLSTYGAVITAFLCEALLLGLYYFVARRYVFNDAARKNDHS